MLTGKILGSGGAGGIPANEYLFGGSATGGTSKTFSSVNLGTEHDSRYIVVGVNTSLANSTKTTAVSVAGVSATNVVNQTFGTYHTSMWIAAVPTGTSGDVVVTAAASSYHVTSVAALYLSSATPTATGWSFNDTTVEVDCNVTGPSGVAIAFACGTITPLTTYGVTFQGRHTASTSQRIDCNFDDGLATETPRTIGNTYASSPASVRLVAATFEGA